MLLPRILHAMRTLERTYVVADQEGTLSELKTSVHRFMYGIDPPVPFDALIAAAYGDGIIPKKALQWRDEIHDAVRAGLAEERRLFDIYQEEISKAHKVLRVGEFVLLRKLPRHKYDTQFERQIYRVNSIKGRKIGLTTVFSHPRGQSRSIYAHIKHLKRVRPDDEDFFKEVPEELHKLLQPLRLPPEAGLLRPPLPEALRSSFDEPRRPDGPTDLRPLLHMEGDSNRAQCLWESIRTQ